MKFKKLITGSIVVTSLFGISLGSSFLRANAETTGTTSSKLPDGSQPLRTTASNDINDKSSNSNDHDNNRNTSTDVKITSGFLNLDSVPNLNFGNNSQAVSQYSTNLGLNSNNVSSQKDGNDQGLLQVTDNRNTNNNQNKGSWKVQANLGQFHKTDNDNDLISNDNWDIKLNQTKGKNDENGIPEIQTPTLNSDNNNHNIIGTTDNTKNGHGTTSVYYQNHDGTSDASLDVPYNVKPGNYTANVNWTLTANTDEGINNG